MGSKVYNKEEFLETLEIIFENIRERIRNGDEHTFTMDSGNTAFVDPIIGYTGHIQSNPFTINFAFEPKESVSKQIKKLREEWDSKNGY